MFGKNKTYTFTSRNELITFLAIEFKKTKDVRKYYPKASVSDLAVKHFDMENTVRLRPQNFPSAPHIVEGELVGEIFTLTHQEMKDALEVIWEFEWDGTIAFA